MADEQLENNKKVVWEFVNTLLNERNPEKASELLGDPYVQHAHGVPDGKEAFVKEISENFLAPFPDARIEVKRYIAEGDLVVAQAHMTLVEGQPGLNSMEMFRVTDGKITEHWVSAAPIPEGDSNNSGAF